MSRLEGRRSPPSEPPPKEGWRGQPALEADVQVPSAANWNSQKRLVLIQLIKANGCYAAPQPRGPHGHTAPAAHRDPGRAAPAPEQAQGFGVVGPCPPAIPGDRRNPARAIDRGGRRADRLPLHRRVRLGTSLQRLG